MPLFSQGLISAHDPYIYTTMSSELSTGKTVFILAVVVGCFAVLWPKVFYPMLTASVKNAPKEGKLGIPIVFCCSLKYRTSVPHSLSESAVS